MQKEQKEQTRKRRAYTAAEFAEVWDRWRRGESSKKIAHGMDRGASVYPLLLRYGGIRPRTRCRSPQALTLAEREEISRGIACGESLRQIARRLARAASTLSREIRRNGGSNRYRAAEADKQAWKRARRPKSCRLVRCPQLRQLVEEKLREDWAPQQIAGWLKRTYPGSESLYVSHETIYRSLFIQARGALKKELTLCLRSKRTIRRSPQASRKGRGGGQIRDLISISERPASVEDRAVPGHWEGDLLAGSNNTYIATLVERHTRYVMLVKVSGKDTATVVSALIAHARQLLGLFDQRRDNRLGLPIRYLHQHQVARVTLDQRYKTTAIASHYQIAFPVTRYDPVFDCSRTLVDRYHVGDLPFAMTFAGGMPGAANRASGG